MDPLLKKLQYRPGSVITVLSAPAELAPTIDAWSADGEVRTRLARDAAFVVAFVRSSDGAPAHGRPCRAQAGR